LQKQDEADDRDQVRAPHQPQRGDHLDAAGHHEQRPGVVFVDQPSGDRREREERQAERDEQHRHHHRPVGAGDLEREEDESKGVAEERHGAGRKHQTHVAEDPEAGRVVK
jgi:hypothetical protein